MRLSRLVLAAVGALSFLGAGTALAAYDSSAAYRAMPGFRCLSWGRDGTCMDFTYYDDGSYRYDPYRSEAYDYRYNTYRPYDPYRSQPSRPVRRISVRVTGSPQTVVPGDTISYAIYLRNNDTVGRTTSLRAFLDPGTDFLSATDGGFPDRGVDEVTWRNVYVPALSSATITLRARVTGRYGTAVRLRVQADGDEDSTTASVTQRCYDRYAYDPYGSRYRGSLSSYDNCYDDRSYDYRYYDSRSYDSRTYDPYYYGRYY